MTADGDATVPATDPATARDERGLPLVGRLAAVPRAAVAGVLFVLAVLTLLQQFAIATVGPMGTIAALVAGGAVPGLLVLMIGRLRR